MAIVMGGHAISGAVSKSHQHMDHWQVAEGLEGVGGHANSLRTHSCQESTPNIMSLSGCSCEMASLVMIVAEVVL